MDPLKSLIVGTGVIAPMHVEAVRAQGGAAVLVGAVDPDEERRAAFCDTFDVPGYADLETAIAASSPDVVHLCTPPVLHTEQAILVLRSGANVFCEKPLTDSLADVARLEEVEAQSPGHLVTVCQWRFGSAARALRDAVASGTLGELRTGLCHTMFFRDQSYYDVAWRGRWESELGGATTTNGTHAIDLVLSLVADWQEVSAFTATVGHQIEVEDVAMANVRLANGAVMSFGASTVSPRQNTAVRLDFEEGTVEVNAEYRYTTANWAFTPRPDGKAVAPWAGVPDVGSSHAAQFATMVDALRAGEQPPASLDHVRPTVEFLASMYKSAVTGRTVKRGEIAEGDPFYTGNLNGMRAAERG